MSWSHVLEMLGDELFESVLTDEAATIQLAQRLATQLSAPLVMYLSGPLGAGKSCFARAFLQAVGVTGRIRSPTFTLVEQYRVDALNLYHLDLYRLTDPEELIFIGMADYVQTDSILLIEWPECGKGFVPKADLSIDLAWLDSGRQVKIRALSPAGHQRLAVLLGSGSA